MRDSKLGQIRDDDDAMRRRSSQGVFGIRRSKNLLRLAKSALWYASI